MAKGALPSSEDSDFVIDFERKREQDFFDNDNNTPTLSSAPEVISSSINSREDHLEAGPSRDGPGRPQSSASAKVKTQWDRVLGSSAKEHLEQVHLEAVQGREKSALPASSAPAQSLPLSQQGGRSRERDSREQRLQLLREKQLSARLHSAAT